MADNGWGSDSSDEVEERVTLASINKRKIIYSNISSTYAAQWGPVEAFREIVQNWRDAIITSHRIHERDFQVTIEENEDEIIYKATANSSPSRKSKKSSECLGYIRWSCQNGAGTVEITNKGASLQPWHLDMGGTSKGNESNQAGIHGEGLKVALLIFLRRPQNNSVTCRSGGFSWKFNFSNQGKLFTTLTRLTPAAIAKMRDEASRESQNTLLPFASTPDEDVQFFIGGTGSGRDEKGYPVNRVEVTREVFKLWTKAALFLQRIDDEKLMRTDQGDLITDERFAGRIYLKGLLLKESTKRKSASLTGLKLKYGYNFATGHTNRERQSMAAADDETSAILSIWDQALAIEPTPAGLVEELHKMLNSRTKYADVADSETHIKSTTAYRLKDYLFSDSLKKKWYFCAREANENYRLKDIIRGLDREPKELKEPYWDILENMNFVRTASEEEEKRFRAAEATDTPPQEPFGQKMKRILLATFASCPQTSPLTLQFVNAGTLGLDAFYTVKEDLIRIHDKWLTPSAAFKELGLANETPQVLDVILIAVRKLIADIMSQLPLRKFHAYGNTQPVWHRSRAINLCEIRIFESLRFEQGLKFFVRRSQETDTLVIRWDTESGWAPGSTIDIQIHHGSTCRHLKDALTAKQVPVFPSTCKQDSSCETVRVEFALGIYEFKNVTEGQERFALVSKPHQPDSFVILAENPHVHHHTATNPVPPQESFSKLIRRTPTNPVPPQESFTKGDPVESMDIIAMEWFRGLSSTGGPEAVIGTKKDKDEGESQRKRRRLETPDRWEGQPSSGAFKSPSNQYPRARWPRRHD